MTDSPETDILEAMARAIWWEEEEPWNAEKYHSKARAALTAALDHMREPSEDMLVAGCGKPMQPFGQKTSGHVWQAMLSQLRKETIGD